MAAKTLHSRCCCCHQVADEGGSTAGDGQCFSQDCPRGSKVGHGAVGGGRGRARWDGAGRDGKGWREEIVWVDYIRMIRMAWHVVVREDDGWSDSVVPSCPAWFELSVSSSTTLTPF